MVKPSETTRVTKPGSSMPISSGRQPTWLSRTLARVSATISHRAPAANIRRPATNSVTVISVTASLVAGVADDHRATAPSMARLASAVLGTVTVVGTGEVWLAGGARLAVGSPKHGPRATKIAAHTMFYGWAAMAWAWRSMPGGQPGPRLPAVLASPWPPALSWPC